MASTMSARAQKRMQKKAVANAAPTLANKSSLSDASIANTEPAFKAKNAGESHDSQDTDMADAEPFAERSDVKKLAVSLVKGTKPLATLSADTTSGVDCPMDGTEPDVSVDDTSFIDDIIVGEVFLYGDEGPQHVQRILDSPQLCKYIRDDPVILMAVVGRVVFAAGYELCATEDKLDWRPLLVRTQLDSIDRGAYADKICALHYVLTGLKLEFGNKLDMAKQAASRAFRKKEGTSYEQYRMDIMRKTAMPQGVKRKTTHDVFCPKTNASGLMAPRLAKETTVQMSGILETLPTTESSVNNTTASTTTVTPATQQAASAPPATFAMRLRM